MRALIGRLMRHPSLRDDPPVLVDIGASGAPPPLWRALAPHAICIAFDADSRDFAVSESQGKGWKKLFRINRLLSGYGGGETTFHLTRSPHCSSALPPDEDALSAWAFRDLFATQATVQMPTTSLPEALEAVGVRRIDWYKSDSQGMDLRLFDSLPGDVVAQIIAADFEPGIIDAYVGEDKLHALMARMDALPFWVSGMTLKGSQRIGRAQLQSLPWHLRRGIGGALRSSPGWCEISYLNDFRAPPRDCRAHLLGWVFAALQGQHGFALELAQAGLERFGDPLFEELLLHSRRRLTLCGTARLAIRAPGAAARRILRFATRLAGRVS